MTTATTALPFTLDDLRDAVADGWVSPRRHPWLPYTIYNYTPKAQFKRVWTPVTRACRGLILDDDGLVIARPFEKFFNLDEHQALGLALPEEPFLAFDKLDGSLGITYWEPGEGQVRLASRGSFHSEQARRGTEILHEAYPRVPWKRELTYLFEIIYPENRIVVDYGEWEDLVLLAAFDRESGEEVPHGELVQWAMDHSLNMAPSLPMSSLEAASRFERTNAEGYVIRFQSGVRVKVKHAEYVRLHRLVTGLTKRHVWEVLAAGDGIPEHWREGLPEEFQDWLDHTVADLQTAASLMRGHVDQAFARIPEGDRKTQALWIQANSKWPHLLFAKLDGKDVDPLIWRTLRPENERPFKEVQ